MRGIHVAISTCVAENVGNSGKALATSSLTLWIVSLFVVTLYINSLGKFVNISNQNGAISGVSIGKPSWIEKVSLR